jgi:branched-chain amino acid transport system permease protein
MSGIVQWLENYDLTLLNGLAMACLLFILASGLTLIFGLLDILNLAHGAMYLIGAYIGYRLAAQSWYSFLAALAVGLVVGAVFGLLLGQMTKPLIKRGHLDQALMTLGGALLIAELLSLFFGDDVHSVPPPTALAGTFEIGGDPYPTYRLLLIAVGLAWAIVMYFVLQRSQLGALIRAIVADRDMVGAMGVDTGRVLMGVFAVGVALATVAGVLGGPMLGAVPGLDEDILLLALIVVVIGGVGSVTGAMVGALVVGEVNAIGVELLPQFASFLLFGAMALVLLFRPAGLIPQRA